MKKLLTLLAVVGVVLVSSNANARVDEDAWVFAADLGPQIGARGYGHHFGLGVAIGSEKMKGRLDMGLGGTIGFRPAFEYQYPFFFSLMNDEDFYVAPVGDVGPNFQFRGATYIDFIQIGFGCRVGWELMDGFGVTFTPVHFRMGFVGWQSGVGVGGNFTMIYDLMFGMYMAL